jgi:hypothetical protein
VGKAGTRKFLGALAMKPAIVVSDCIAHGQRDFECKGFVVAFEVEVMPMDWPSNKQVFINSLFEKLLTDVCMVNKLVYRCFYPVKKKRNRLNGFEFGRCWHKCLF